MVKTINAVLYAYETECDGVELIIYPTLSDFIEYNTDYMEDEEEVDEYIKDLTESFTREGYRAEGGALNPNFQIQVDEDENGNLTLSSPIGFHFRT